MTMCNKPIAQVINEINNKYIKLLKKISDDYAAGKLIDNNELKRVICVLKNIKRLKC